jgi:molecular chaperone GrpE
MSEEPNPMDAELPSEPITADADEGEVFELDASASVLERALADTEERFLRLAAEYDNYRRRTTKEKTESFDRGASSLASRLLDTLDDIDRLGTSDPLATTAEAFRSAFDLIQKKLRKELEAAGLEWIEPAGTPFDPTQHDAVAVVAPETPEQDHTVKATFQTGYRYKGSVIRPARVQVYSEQGAA